MKTTTTKEAEIKRSWHLVDLSDGVLGRNASKIAELLMGKGKADYSPNIDMGDFVVAINSDKIAVTGRKTTDKMYYHHSGFPGGLRKQTFNEKMAINSEDVIRLAVKGMLPKNKLQDRRMTRLKVVKGDTHPYQSQLPTNK